MQKRTLTNPTPTPKAPEPVVGQTIWYYDDDSKRMLQATITDIDDISLGTACATLNRATDKFHVVRPSGDVYTEASVANGAPELVPAEAKPTHKVGDKLDVMHAPSGTWKGAEIVSIDPNGDFAKCRIEGMTKAGQYNLATDTAPYRSRSVAPAAEPEPFKLTIDNAAPANEPEPFGPVTKVQVPSDAPINQISVHTSHEVAAHTGGSWYGGIGFNPEALRERPRVTFGMSVGQHMERGIKLGDLALGDMILSSIRATGPNGMGKDGDRSDRTVNFFVLFVRHGMTEDIPYAETEANKDLRAQIAWSKPDLQRLTSASRYPLKNLADIYVLIEQPEGISDTSKVFSVEIAGKMHAPAIIRARNSGYRALLGPISTIGENHPGKLPFFRFGLAIRLYKGKTMISIPDVSRLGFIGEEHRAKLAEASVSVATIADVTGEDDAPSA